MVGALIVAGGTYRSRVDAAAKTASQWTPVEAVVVSSTVREVDASTETAFSTRLTVNAKFSYVYEGRPRTGNYFGSWSRTDYRDWSELLRPGRRILIRVSPDDPETVSLVEYNGIR